MIVCIKMGDIIVDCFDQTIEKKCVGLKRGENTVKFSKTSSKDVCLNKKKDYYVLKDEIANVFSAFFANNRDNLSYE